MTLWHGNIFRITHVSFVRGIQQWHNDTYVTWLQCFYLTNYHSVRHSIITPGRVAQKYQRTIWNAKKKHKKWSVVWKSVLNGSPFDALFAKYRLRLTHVLTHVSIKVSNFDEHYTEVIMGVMASQISGVSIVCWTVYQSSASLAFVGEIYRWPVDSPHYALWKVLSAN